MSHLDAYTLTFSWFKESRSRHAIDALENSGTNESYCVMVSCDNGAYRVSADDHDVCDIDQPAEGFATLKAAKAHAVEFAQFFQATVWAGQ